MKTQSLKLMLPEDKWRKEKIDSNRGTPKRIVSVGNVEMINKL